MLISCLKPAFCSIFAMRLKTLPQLLSEIFTFFFGFPLLGVRIRVVGGGSSPGKDSEIGFAQAGAGALRAALADAAVDLLEPLMAFTVETPADFVYLFKSADEVTVQLGETAREAWLPMFERRRNEIEAVQQVCGHGSSDTTC